MTLLTTQFTIEISRDKIDILRTKLILIIDASNLFLAFRKNPARDTLENVVSYVQKPVKVDGLLVS